MSETTFSTFAVAGAGTVGIPLIQALVARGASVIVITRPSSSGKTFPSGVKVESIGYTDVPALTSAFRNNQVKVVISTINGEGFEAQKKLAEAAKQAGVHLFVPSEFGLPNEGATESYLQAKAGVVEYVRSISLPYLRLYTGFFYEYVPWIATVPETNKFLILGKGDTPGSFTGLGDITEYLAYVLTVLPPSKLSNVTLRIEGERLTMNEIGKLYKGKIPVEHVTKLPDSLLMWEYRVSLQNKLEAGKLSNGWDYVTGKEISEPSSGNSLWEGRKFKSIKEALNL